MVDSIYSACNQRYRCKYTLWICKWIALDVQGSFSMSNWKFLVWYTWCFNSSIVWNSVACYTHCVKKYSAIGIMFSDNSPLQRSKRSFWPSSIALCSPEAFVPTLLVVSEPIRACIAGKMSTTSVSNWSNMVCSGIANFALLFPATIQSSFNPK